LCLNIENIKLFFEKIRLLDVIFVIIKVTERKKINEKFTQFIPVFY
jgi:hypothetical protein